MIHVIATLRIDPTKREEFLKIFAELTPLVLAEEGCIEYGAAADVPTPIAVQQMVGDEAVMVIEKWESVAHLEAHLAAPHMDDFRTNVADILKEVTLLALQPA